MDNKNNQSHDYEMGLRDGKIASLESSVAKIAEDLAKFKVAIYMLYGAIALMQFLPTLERVLNRAGP
jgi:hypothetical protein